MLDQTHESMPLNSLQTMLGNNSAEIIQSFAESPPEVVKTELVELFVFLIGYVGFAATVEALKTAKDVLLAVTM